MVDYTQATVTQFNRGLITEASEMTFPEGASVDELNCDLFPDGSRRRRLGIEIESGSELSTNTVGDTTTVSTHIWENVAEQADTNWLVVQTAAILQFYDLGGTGALSANQVQESASDYELDLTPYEAPLGNGAASSAIQVTSVKGALVVASPDINTIYIVYDPTTTTFTVTEITFRVRDYEYLTNTSLLDEEATPTISEERKYDTANTGWVGTKGAAALSTYTGANSGNYPALTLAWYSGKDNSGNFSESEWQKIFSGNTLIANGHFLLDLYNKDRAGVSGFSVTNVTEDARFSTVETHAGRVWYAGMKNSTADNGNKVFFSQVLEFGFDRIGNLHQVNDPTSEQLSDLLDTDGGYVTIPGAHDIRKLHQFGSDLYVMAANGVWRIAGVDGVFRASEYSVQKLSEDGIVAVGSFVSASGKPYWWSNNGIHTLGVVEGGAVGVNNISIESVQTFWENIGASKRALVRGIYDKNRRRVAWLYPDTDETIENKRNRILFFDEILGAFIPWSIADQSANTDYIVDAVFNTGVTAGQVTYSVVDSSGNQVTDAAGDPVVVTRSGQTLSSSSITFLVVDGTTGSFTFAGATDTEFQDWGDTNYISYAEPAYSFLGDAETRKTLPYVTTYLKTTETGWIVDGDGYATVRPSGCTVTCYWDFKTEPSFKPQEMYRLKYPVAVDTSALSTYDYPATMVTSRIKMRGRGRVMKLRFESVEGKDFHLIGYHLIGARVGRF